MLSPLYWFYLLSIASIAVADNTWVLFINGTRGESDGISRYDCEEGEENPKIAGALFLPLQLLSILFTLFHSLSHRIYIILIIYRTSNVIV